MISSALPRPVWRAMREAPPPQGKMPMLTFVCMNLYFPRAAQRMSSANANSCLSPHVNPSSLSSKNCQLSSMLQMQGQRSYRSKPHVIRTTEISSKKHREYTKPLVSTTLRATQTVEFRIFELNLVASNSPVSSHLQGLPRIQG